VDCRHIDAEVAGGVARGDIDPITLQPMVDIMPSFQPRKHPARSQPLAVKDYNRREITDDKKTTPAKGSLFQYFCESLHFRHLVMYLV
jgi:exonuclease 1